LLCACGDAGSPRPQDLRQDTYIWQRQWTAATADAAHGTDKTIRQLLVLAAEFPATDGASHKMNRIPVPWEKLRGRDIGVVLRIHRPDKAFFDGDPRPLAETVGTTASQVLTDARTLRIHECQIDFDCPTRSLETFAPLMRALRAREADMRWTFTALPDWLGRDGFGDLARSADGFVLQVHSLKLPEAAARVVPLCTVEESVRWIGRASRVGVPFRVALPTYFSRVFFDLSGRVIDVVSEEPESAAAQQADAVALAVTEVDTLLDLRARLWCKPPANFEGICWFRLPTADDRWILSTEAFAKVLRGARPKSGIRLRADAQPEGFLKIVAENTGEIPVVPPIRVSLIWDDGHRLVAADGVAATRMRPSGCGATVEWREREWPTLLAPGERRILGWIRLDPADAGVRCVPENE